MGRLGGPLEKMPSQHTSDGDLDRELLKCDRHLEVAHHVARLWWIGILRRAIALLLQVSALLASGSAEATGRQR
jgi:hypothetical protein